MSRILVCPFCDFRFDLSYGRVFACRGCSLAAIEGCGLAKCPRCGREFEI